MSTPRTVVRAEAAAIGALALYLFGRGDWSWWLFAALILAPDLAILGWAVNKRVGAAAYNLAHAYVWPVGLAIYGVGADHDTALAIGLVWAAHIAVDRALGFGLKYPTDFKDTHLQRL